MILPMRLAVLQRGGPEVDAEAATPDRDRLILDPGVQELLHMSESSRDVFSAQGACGADGLAGGLQKRNAIRAVRP